MLGVILTIVLITILRFARKHVKISSTSELVIILYKKLRLKQTPVYIIVVVTVTVMF